MPHSPTTRFPNQKYIRATLQLNAALDAGASWSGRERNRIFLNQGDTRFTQISACSGLDFIDDARGVGLVDWDHDGDLDMWISNRTGPRLRLMRNDTPQENHFLAIRLVGTSCNRDAIGARVELELAAVSATDKPLRRVKTLRAGEGFIAQSSKELHFGLGRHEQIERLVVRWPDGAVETFDKPAADTRYRLEQASGELQPVEVERQVELAVSTLHDRGAPDLAAIRLPSRRNFSWLEYKLPAGDEVTVGKQVNGPVLINLWATWCQPCLKELKEFSEQADTIRESGVQILALDMTAAGGQQGGSDPEDILQRIDFPFEWGTIEKASLAKVVKQLKAALAVHPRLAAPTSLLLDADHQLVAIYRGPIDVETLCRDAELTTLDESQLVQRATPFTGRWFFNPAE